MLKKRHNGERQRKVHYSQIQIYRNRQNNRENNSLVRRIQYKSEDSVWYSLSLYIRITLLTVFYFSSSTNIRRNFIDIPIYNGIKSYFQCLEPMTVNYDLVICRKEDEIPNGGEKFDRIGNLRFRHVT